MGSIATRPYRSQRRAEATARTRGKIVAAVHDLLVEGAFHASSVEDVANRAGVSRATVYQHFGSRLDLINALCDSLAANPALLAVRKAVELSEPSESLSEFIAQTVRFWASEEALHQQLYGLATIDSAAQDYVRRQREDRGGEVERLATRLVSAGALKAGVGERTALARLLMLSSFEAYEELRRTGLSAGDAERTLRRMAQELLLPS